MAKRPAGTERYEEMKRSITIGTVLMTVAVMGIVILGTVQCANFVTKSNDHFDSHTGIKYTVWRETQDGKRVFVAEDAEGNQATSDKMPLMAIQELEGLKQ